MIPCKSVHPATKKAKPKRCCLRNYHGGDKTWQIIHTEMVCCNYLGHRDVSSSQESQPISLLLTKLYGFPQKNYISLYITLFCAEKQNTNSNVQCFMKAQRWVGFCF